MKTKYERMSKEEKKELFNKFKEEKQTLYKKFRNMFILCYVGIVYSVLVFFYDFFIKHSKLNFIIDIIIFVFCLIALLKIYSMKKEVLNNFALKK